MPLLNSEIRDNFLEIIKNFDRIAIFRHQNPDGDALASSFGLCLGLKQLFPEKKIAVLSNDESRLSSFFPKYESWKDEEFKDVCAIIVDTANAPRISGDQWKLCSLVIKIDHHVDNDAYANWQWVNEKYSSCAEMIAQLLSLYGLDVQTARYLLTGIMTDTLSFTTSNVDKHTFNTIADLVALGANVSDIQNTLMLETKNEFDFKGWIYQSYVQKESFFYCIVEPETFEKYGLNHNQAKDPVNLFKPLKEAAIWAIFSKNPLTHNYDGSIRSRVIEINHIASLYGGGGHKLACGIKNLSNEKLNQLITDLSQLSKHSL